MGTFFYCPYTHCYFNSDSQIKTGDHVMLNHIDEHIERNAQPPDLIECNLCFEQVPSEKTLKQHISTIDSSGCLSYVKYYGIHLKV